MAEMVLNINEYSIKINLPSFKCVFVFLLRFLGRFMATKTLSLVVLLFPIYNGEWFATDDIIQRIEPFFPNKILISAVTLPQYCTL